MPRAQATAPHATNATTAIDAAPIGTRAGLGAEPIDDGILAALSRVTLVGQCLAGNAGIDGEGRTRTDVFGPIDGMHTLIQVLFVLAIEMGNRPQHPGSQTGMHDQCKRITQIAFGIDPGHRGGRLDTHGGGLVDQQILQAFGTGQEEFHDRLPRNRANCWAQKSTCAPSR